MDGYVISPIVLISVSAVLLTIVAVVIIYLVTRDDKTRDGALLKTAEPKSNIINDKPKGVAASAMSLWDSSSTMGMYDLEEQDQKPSDVPPSVNPSVNPSVKPSLNFQETAKDWLNLLIQAIPDTLSYLVNEFINSLDSSSSDTLALSPEVLRDIPTRVRDLLTSLTTQSNNVRTINPSLAPSENPTAYLNAIVMGIYEARKKLYQQDAVRPPRVRVLVYVNAGIPDGDDSLSRTPGINGPNSLLNVKTDIQAALTPGFTESAKAFFSLMKERSCWQSIYANVFYANDFTNQGVAQLAWTFCLTEFFSDMAPGDKLVFMILTHGATDAKGMEFMLGGMDEKNLTSIAKKLPSGVDLFLYTSGCEQSSPVDCPYHITVDDQGRRMGYNDNTADTYNARIVTLTDSWRGYLSQFEPPVFNVPGVDMAFTSIMLNFLANELPMKSYVTTYNDFFKAYAQSGWHLLRANEVPPGYSEVVEQNIMNGTWNMFRPVIGFSVPDVFDSSCRHWICPG